MCFILRAAQLTEPPADRSGTAAWRQQRRAETLLPATQTPAPLPDCDRNRRLPSELLGSEATKPSKAPGPAQTCDPPGRFVFGRSRVFLFLTDPRQRTQKAEAAQTRPFHNSPPQEPLQRLHQAVSGCPSARTNPEPEVRWPQPGLGGPNDRPLRSHPVPSRVTAPSPSVMENMRSEPVRKNLKGSEGCGGLWPGLAQKQNHASFHRRLEQPQTSIRRFLPPCLTVCRVEALHQQVASWETGAACRLTRQHVCSLCSVWFQMGIFEQTS